MSNKIEQDLQSKHMPEVRLYEFEGKPIRVYVNESGEVTFCFEDVAKALGYNSTEEAIRDCFKDERELEDFLKKSVTTLDPFVSGAMNELIKGSNQKN